MKHLYNKRFQWSFIIILISWSFFVFNIASSENSPSPESKDPLAYEIQLDDREKAWLENHKKVRIGTSQYPPLTYMDDSGIMVGISADYLKQISERTGLKFEAEYFVWADLMKQSKNKGIDMFSGLKNSEREKYLNFTNPYLQVSYVVINRIKTPFLGDFSILNGQKVAVVKDWTVHKLMQKDFPKIKIVPFNSVPEALTAVSNSRVEAYVGDLLTASYQIQKNVLTNLKVAASAPFRNDSVRFAVRKDWPELTTILDKAIHSLSREEHDSILHKWLQLRFEKGVDWSLVWRWSGGIGGFLCLIIIMTLAWNRRLSQEIKHRKKIEADLILAEESANVANLAKSEFLANMSHEIRTPLNAILGFSEIMKKKINDPQLSDHIEVIHSNGKALLSLLNDILDLSRIESGRVEPDPEKVNMEEMCQEIEQLFVWEMLEKEIAFTVDIDPALPKGLLLDEKRLRQVIVNLVGNAVKFTDKGFIKLTVKQIPLNTEDCIKLFISITDTGIGIPKDQYEIIFDPFMTQKGQDDYKYQSKGLGLSITKKLVGIMNGTISLESNLGVGSVFSVILDDVKVASLENNDNFETEKNDFKNISFEKASILVVDDLQDNIDLIKAFLTDTNIDIMEAGNGREAIDFARKYYPKLIFMDLRMPILDGYETIKILQNDKELKSIPVVALTAAAMKEDSVKALKSGFNGYLRKPVNKKELLSEMIRFLPHKTK